MAAVGRWRADKAADATAQDAVIEVLDSGVYAEPIDIPLDEGDHLELRAAPGTRPVIMLLDWYANRPDAMRVYGTGQPNGTAASGPGRRGRAAAAAGLPGHRVRGVPRPPMPTFVLDGFLVTGRSLLVTGPVARVTIRHCTLVPGWSLECDCTAAARRGAEHRAHQHAREAGRRPRHHRLDPGDRRRASQRPDPDRRPRQHHRRHQRQPAGHHRPGRRLCVRHRPAAAVHGHRHGPGPRPRARRQHHLPRADPGGPPPAGMRALLLDRAGVEDAEPVRMPARPGPAGHQRRSRGRTAWRRRR